MTHKDIDKTISYLRIKIKEQGTHPNQILMRGDALVKNMAVSCGFSIKEATLILSVIISNDILIYDSLFIKLSDIGYSIVNRETPLKLRLSLNEIISLSPGVPIESIFYSLWEIVGADQYENPFYIDGKTFFNSIKKFIPNIPPTYSQYTSRLQESGKSTARSIWCKDLFMALPYEEIRVFFQQLSEEVNKRLSNSEGMTTVPLDDSQDTYSENMWPNSQSIADVALNEEKQENKKDPKIFISHNSADKDYASALVNLLVALGVNEEKNIFCSSVPGCGVEFGKSFIEAIKNQYENYELMVVFIHSPRFYQSPVSLCEMGAAWILKKQHRSFLTKDCEFDMLKGVVPSSEIAFKAGAENTYHLLNDFKNLIEMTFSLASKSISRWEHIKNIFITSVSK